MALIRAVGQTNQRPNAPTRQQWGSEPTSHQLGHRASSQATTDQITNRSATQYGIRHRGIKASRHPGINIHIHIHNANWRRFCVLSSLWPSLCLSCVCFVDFTDFSLSLCLFTALPPKLSFSRCLSLSILSLPFVAVAVGNFLALLTFHFVGMENFILHYCKGS